MGLENLIMVQVLLQKENQMGKLKDQTAMEVRRELAVEGQLLRKNNSRTLIIQRQAIRLEQCRRREKDSERRVSEREVLEKKQGRLQTAMSWKQM